MSSEKKVNVTLKITKELYEELKKQLEFLKNSNLAKFQDINTVEELVSQFLSSFKYTQDRFDNIQEKIFSAFDDLDKKQRLIKDIFNAFAQEWKGFKPEGKETPADEFDEELLKEFEELVEEQEKEEAKRKEKKKVKVDKDKKN